MRIRTGRFEKLELDESRHARTVKAGDGLNKRTSKESGCLLLACVCVCVRVGVRPLCTRHSGDASTGAQGIGGDLQISYLYPLIYSFVSPRVKVTGYFFRKLKRKFSFKLIDYVTIYKYHDSSILMKSIVIQFIRL